MARQRKRDEIEDLPAVMGEDPVLVEKAMIPFTLWFDRKLKAGKVRFYQNEAVLVFFRKKGLRNQEPEAVYDETFTKF